MSKLPLSTDVVGMQYHLHLSKETIENAEYALVPGDPGRVESLAKAFDPNAKFLASNREYTSYLANFHGQKVLVCSTGIGGPSASIAVEELANIGIRYFLRIGTTGAIQPHIKVGDLIITKAAVRLDGASSHYAPLEYPAVASLRFTCDVVDAAEDLKIPYHVGITVTSDTFYPGQERYDNHSHYVMRRFQGSLEEWRKLNVTNYEMEAATLFTMTNVFGLHAACLCGVIINRTISEHVDAAALEKAAHHWLQVAVRTIYLNMKRRGLIS